MTQRVNRADGRHTPQERLILALFDLIELGRQARLLEACKQIHINSKREARSD
jgi:hypothetical protein